MKITENIGVGLHNVNSNHTVIIIVFFTQLPQVYRNDEVVLSHIYKDF